MLKQYQNAVLSVLVAFSSILTANAPAWANVQGLRATIIHRNGLAYRFENNTLKPHYNDNLIVDTFCARKKQNALCRKYEQEEQKLYDTLVRVNRMVINNPNLLSRTGQGMTIHPIWSGSKIETNLALINTLTHLVESGYHLGRLNQIKEQLEKDQEFQDLQKNFANVIINNNLGNGDPKTKKAQERQALQCLYANRVPVLLDNGTIVCAKRTDDPRNCLRAITGVDLTLNQKSAKKPSNFCRDLSQQEELVLQNVPDQYVENALQCLSANMTPFQVNGKYQCLPKASADKKCPEGYQYAGEASPYESPKTKTGYCTAKQDPGKPRATGPERPGSGEPQPKADEPIHLTNGSDKPTDNTPTQRTDNTNNTNNSTKNEGKLSLQTQFLHANAKRLKNDAEQMYQYAQDRVKHLETMSNLEQQILLLQQQNFDLYTQQQEQITQKQNQLSQNWANSANGINRLFSSNRSSRARLVR